jgi:hypothetical protein
MLRRVAVAVVAALVATSTAGALPPPPPANPKVLADCLGKPQIRPTEIVLACGDGNESIDGLTWVGWGSRFAAGRGTISINDCSPSCVAGHDHSYPVVVLTTGHERCTPSGKLAYRSVTIAFLDGKPHTTVSQTFPCRVFK